MTTILHILLRFMIITLSVIVCAFASALASLLTLHWSLPPTDAAYGIPFRRILADPFVRDIWVIYSVLGTVICLLFALGLLWRTNLLKSIPITATVTIITAVICGPMNPMFAALLALFFGILTMVLFRVTVPASEPDPTDPKVPGK